MFNVYLYLYSLFREQIAVLLMNYNNEMMMMLRC